MHCYGLITAVLGFIFSCLLFFINPPIMYFILGLAWVCIILTWISWFID